MLISENLGIGLKCIKYLLVAFNVLFAVSGVLLVLTAVLVGQPLSQLTPILDSSLLSPAVLLGVAGVAVITVSCFGVWGALRHSTVLVTTFAALLGLLLFLELGAGIAAFLMQDGLRSMLFENIWEAMHYYDESPQTAEVIDRMQSELFCCGVMDPSDWQSVRNDTLNLPLSCCSGIYLFTNETANDTCLFDDVIDIRPGCLRKMGLLIDRGSAFIASTAVVTAFTQFLGILFACTLGRSIRHQKTLRELRRVQLRERLVNTYSPVSTKPTPQMTITY